MSNSIDPHLAAQQGRCQRVADTDQTLVHRRLSPRKLCKSWKRNWIFPGRRSKPSALKCINVKNINYINVVQRCLQTREEARALGIQSVPTFEQCPSLMAKRETYARTEFFSV